MVCWWSMSGVTSSAPNTDFHIPALAAGNTVVVKPSEYASASILEFTRLIGDLLPAGVLNIVCGGGESVGSGRVGVAAADLRGGNRARTDGSFHQGTAHFPATDDAEFHVAAE